MSTLTPPQGDDFSLRVVNELTDDTMPLETSVVSRCTLHKRHARHPHRLSRSIGTEFFNTSPTGLMVLQQLLSALFVNRKHSCRNSMPKIRPGHTGTTPILQISIAMDSEDPS